MSKKKHVETIDFGNGVVGHVYEIPGIVPLWPPFWRHPFRHVRMKRAVREYERRMAEPMVQRLRELEDETFLRGTGA